MDVLNHAKVYIVINFNRIESRLEYISELIDLFENRSHLRIAGLVHNTHMLDETTAEMILSAQTKCEELSKQLNLPIIYTMVRKDFYEECKEMIHNECVIYDKLILREEWMKGDTL
jgi:GTPase SAR1 family protein